MVDELTIEPTTSRQPLAIVAIGGNAVIPAGVVGTHREQLRAGRRLARSVVQMIREGYRVLVVHGNGPQAGREMLRSEEAATKMPLRPLDVCVASTQGTMGFLIVHQLQNELKRCGMRRPVAALMTEVLVSRADPAFDVHTKPIGPFYSAFRAKELQRGRGGWRMMEDAGRGWRRVVASPKPIDIINLAAIEDLLEAGHVVVAGGGGGIPVAINDHGELIGVEAVIDKDRTATLLGSHLGAGLLVLLTPADQVFVNFGRTDQRGLEHVTADELRGHLEQNQFPPGSMGPKVEASLDFLADGGSAVVITSMEKLAAALADRAGTRVTHEATDATLSKQLDLFPQPDVEPPGEPSPSTS